MFGRRAAHTTIAQRTRKEKDPSGAHRTGVAVERKTWPPVRRYRRRENPYRLAGAV